MDNLVFLAKELRRWVSEGPFKYEIMTTKGAGPVTVGPLPGEAPSALEAGMQAQRLNSMLLGALRRGKKKGASGRRASGGGLTPPPGMSVGGSAWEANQRIAAIQGQDVDAIAEQMQAETLAKYQAASDKKIAKIHQVMAALDQSIAKHRELNETQRASVAIMSDLAINGFGSLTGAIMSAAMAAAEGSSSFGAAIAAELKATATAKAIEASIMAGMAWGKYFLSWGMDASALAAAKTYTATAIIAGTVAGAAHAVIPGGGGGSASGGGGGEYRPNSYRPEFGQREQREQQTVVVNHYVGHKGDLGARAYMRREFEAELKRAGR